MSKKSNFIKVLFVAIAFAFATNTAVAQELIERKHGSVLEQLEQSSINDDPNQNIISEMLDYAMKYRGTRYRSGSSSPKGFDCSGFTSFVFRKFGYTLKRSSSAQVENGTPVDKDDLQPGDLVFFNGRALGSRIGHVGIVTSVGEDGDFEFIHSSNSKGVVVSSSDEPYYKRRYVKACRVLSQVQESNDVKPFQLFDVSTWK